MRKVGGTVLIALGIIAAVSLRLANIDMSETRLFLEHWDNWLFAAVVCIVGAILLFGDKDE